MRSGKQVRGLFGCVYRRRSLCCASNSHLLLIASMRACTLPGGASGPPWWSDADACLEFLFQKKHQGARCRNCKRSGRYYRNQGKLCFTCACGGSHIYPRKGTVFEYSPLSLPTWFLAIWYLSVSDTTVSSSTLASLLGISVQTGSRMLQILEQRRPTRAPVTFERFLERCLR